MEDHDKNGNLSKSLTLLIKRLKFFDCGALSTERPSWSMRLSDGILRIGLCEYKASPRIEDDSIATSSFRVLLVRPSAMPETFRPISVCVANQGSKEGRGEYLIMLKSP